MMELIKGWIYPLFPLVRKKNICPSVIRLTSTLFCEKQFGVGINKEIKLIVCVLIHSCAGAWLTRELCEAEQKMNHPLEGGLLTILTGGADFGY